MKFSLNTSPNRFMQDESIQYDTNESIQNKSESIHCVADESIQYRTESILHGYDKSIHTEMNRFNQSDSIFSWQTT